MSLTDRDYMNERDRESPFSPPPERFGAMSKVLVFVVALFLLYKVADWKLSQRAAEQVRKPSSVTTAPISQSAESATQSLPQTSSYSNTPEVTGNTRTVTKCIVNGKTSYGDGGCAAGAKATQIATKENHNLMAAVRVPVPTKEDMPTQSLSVVTQSDPGVDHAVMKAECNALEERVKHLDSMARQPQNGQTQDWIRDERKKARDRQARIPCR